MNSNNYCNGEEGEFVDDVLRMPDRIVIAPPPDL